MRPKPTLVMSAPVPGTDHLEEVVAAIDDAVYAVVLDGRPIGLRRTHPQVNGAKYMMTAYTNKGHAFRLAGRLNHTHKTAGFGVLKMTTGTMVEPETPPVIRPRRASPAAIQPPTRRR